MVDTWYKINQTLKDRLQHHKYRYIDAVRLIGCGYKTLQRYMNEEFVAPLKVSDEWFFTEDMISKCKFISKMSTHKYCTVHIANKLYDYMASHGIQAIYEDIFKEN